MPDQPGSGLSCPVPAQRRRGFRSARIVKGTLSMLDTGSAETLRPGELVWLTILPRIWCCQRRRRMDLVDGLAASGWGLVHRAARAGAPIET
jgi:hypothetical protein